MANGSRRRTSSRRPRAGKKGGGIVGKFIWGIVVLSLIVTFFQIPHDPTVKGTWAIMVSKSQQIEKWATGVGQGLENGDINLPSGPGGGTAGGGSAPGGAGGTGGSGTGGATGGGAPASDPSAANSKLDTLAVADDQKVEYNRKEWKHWINVRSCWNVREQVLAEEAVPGSLSLLDGSGKATTDLNTACEVVSGEWNDPYTGKKFTDPGKLDVDHMIPLGQAAAEGGQAWDSARKQAYANNLAYPNHLVAVDASANRSKSDKGPGEWKPSNKAYWCEYATAQVDIRSEWGLTVNKADKAALKDMLATCS
jgi:hypothetical protein